MHKLNPVVAKVYCEINKEIDTDLNRASLVKNNCVIWIS